VIGKNGERGGVVGGAVDVAVPAPAPVSAPTPAPTIVVRPPPGFSSPAPPAPGLEQKLLAEQQLHLQQLQLQQTQIYQQQVQQIQMKQQAQAEAHQAHQAQKDPVQVQREFYEQMQNAQCINDLIGGIKIGNERTEIESIFRTNDLIEQDLSALGDQMVDSLFD